MSSFGVSETISELSIYDFDVNDYLTLRMMEKSFSFCSEEVSIVC